MKLEERCQSLRYGRGGRPRQWRGCDNVAGNWSGSVKSSVASAVQPENLSHTVCIQRRGVAEREGWQKVLAAGLATTVAMERWTADEVRGPVPRGGRDGRFMYVGDAANGINEQGRVCTSLQSRNSPTGTRPSKQDRERKKARVDAQRSRGRTSQRSGLDRSAVRLGFCMTRWALFRIRDGWKAGQMAGWLGGR